MFNKIREKIILLLAGESPVIINNDIKGDIFFSEGKININGELTTKSKTLIFKKNNISHK